MGTFCGTDALLESWICGNHNSCFANSSKEERQSTCSDTAQQNKYQCAVYLKDNLSWGLTGGCCNAPLGEVNRHCFQMNVQPTDRKWSNTIDRHFVGQTHLHPADIDRLFGSNQQGNISELANANKLAG